MCAYWKYFYFFLSITASLKFAFFVWQQWVHHLSLHSFQVAWVIIQCIARLMVMTFDRVLLFRRHIGEHWLRVLSILKRILTVGYSMGDVICDSDYAQTFKVRIRTSLRSQLFRLCVQLFADQQCVCWFRHLTGVRIVKVLLCHWLLLSRLLLHCCKKKFFGKNNLEFMKLLPISLKSIHTFKNNLSVVFFSVCIFFIPW